MGPEFMSGPTRVRNHYLNSGRDIYTRNLDSSPHPVIIAARFEASDDSRLFSENELTTKAHVLITFTDIE